MNISRRSLVFIGIFLILTVLFIKIYFFSPWNRDVAQGVAIETLKNYAERKNIDFQKLGTFHEVTGDQDGYYFKLQVVARDSPAYTDLVIMVSELDDNMWFSGLELDCRKGKDEETHATGFGYLCRTDK